MQTDSNANTENGLVRFLVERMPAHLKRLVFLSSLTGVALNSKEPDDEFIGKLNSIMNLSDTGDKALRLPIYVNGLIWKYKEHIQSDLDTLKNPTISREQKQACISRINKRISPWLKYADSNKMTMDLCKLFNSDNCLFTPTTGKA